VGPKNTPGINAKTCGNIVAGCMDFISFLFTRSPALGLNEVEEREMGESLFETVSNFPATSASVRLLNFLAPWAGLLHTSSKIVWKRMAFLSQVKAQQTQSKVPKGPPVFDPNPTNEKGVFYAPDPSLVN
jgi:hypothetical protein